MTLSIKDSVAAIDNQSLTESLIKQHIYPLFRVTLGEQKNDHRIYLANHSLGRPLDRTMVDVMEGLNLWYANLDDSWEEFGWPLAMSRFQSLIADLIKLKCSDCVIPKSSAGQGLRAVLNSFPYDKVLNIVTTSGEFDSIDHILKAYESAGKAKITYVQSSLNEQQVPIISTNEIVSAISKETDLVVVSHVQFTTGQIIQNTESISQKAKECDSLFLIDAYHSFGVIPIDFESLDCDFMIGGSYKYVRGGPGACWLAIHPIQIEKGRRSLDTGWFAKENPFEYLRPVPPKYGSGGNSWLESTPPVLTFYQALAGLELIQAIRVERLREYNLVQRTNLHEFLSKTGVSHFCPEDLNQFGAFSLIQHKDAANRSAELKSAHGLVTDARSGFVRLGPDILNDFEELDRAANILGTYSW